MIGRRVGRLPGGVCLSSPQPERGRFLRLLIAGTGFPFGQCWAGGAPCWWKEEKYQRTIAALQTGKEEGYDREKGVGKTSIYLTINTAQELATSEVRRWILSNMPRVQHDAGLLA